MLASVASNGSISSPETIIFSPSGPSPPPLMLKTIHLNGHINPIDPRTTAICPSPSPSRRSIIQSDGQDDSSHDSAATSPCSQGHPPAVITSLPTTPFPGSGSPTSPAPPPKLQRANSNPTLGSTAPIVFPASTPPLRRRQSSSSPPPSRLQTIPIEPQLRRQGSGADLSPIDECRASECDGKRKARLAREAAELARLQALFLSDGSDDDMDQREPRQGRDVGEEKKEVGEKGLTVEKKTDKKAKRKKKKDPWVINSYGRVFDDPFSAAVVLLVLPFCPPLAVWLTFRECGGMNHRRERQFGLCVLLTVLGWLPGLAYSLIVYFRHLPRPVNTQEKQALHLSPRQRSRQCSDMLS